MKKIIDPVSIKSVSKYTSNKLEELIDAKNTLVNDISKIKLYYNGVDADLIINKYLERLKIIDLIVLNYSNLVGYCSNISLEYSNNLNDAKKIMNQINNNINNNEIVEDDLSNQTLSIDL